MSLDAGRESMNRHLESGGGQQIAMPTQTASANAADVQPPPVPALGFDSKNDRGPHCAQTVTTRMSYYIRHRYRGHLAWLLLAVYCHVRPYCRSYLLVPSIMVSHLSF